MKPNYSTKMVTVLMTSKKKIKMAKDKIKGALDKQIQKLFIIELIQM
jgi:hypothetical protein